MSTKHIVRAVAGLTVLTVVAGACSSDQISTTDDTTTTSPPPATTTSPATSVVDTTTTTDTLAPTTTIAPTTTTEPPITAADLTLAADGVLPLLFGDADSDVISELTTALGAPNFDGAQTYPDVDGSEYLDATGEEAYVHPVGRTVCFVNDLCAQFGGATVDTLTFTGWDITGDGPPQLATADGIMVGSNVEAFLGVVTIDEGGCYWVGYGDADGVSLTLFSEGVPFVEVDPDGNWIINTPDPADISVLNMSAGELPYFLFEDC